MSTVLGLPSSINSTRLAPAAGEVLKPVPLKPAGEIETIGTRRAVDGALVGGDAIAPHMDGMQAALFDFGNTLNHRINEFLKEGGRGRLVFGVGWFTTQLFIFARGEDQRTALGSEVTIDDIVYAGGDAAQRRRTVEERDIMRPRLKRDLDACEACDLLCPRSSRIDDDGRVEITFLCADAFDLACPPCGWQSLDSFESKLRRYVWRLR